MTKISIRSYDDAAITTASRGVSGAQSSKAYFDAAEDPIHLHLHEVGPDGRLTFLPEPHDRAVYVWTGEIAVGETLLTKGSSLIVERGAPLKVVGVAEQSRLVSFAAMNTQARAGGHIHLLPLDRVPSVDGLAGIASVAGALHADASCPTCSVWLHENRMAPPMKSERSEGGVHAHTEDEIIFVTTGELLFGTQRCGPGSALAISADAFYSFSVGEAGLGFVNFRGALPGNVRFKGGHTVDEVSYWRPLGTPDYLTTPASETSASPKGVA